MGYKTTFDLFGAVGRDFTYIGTVGIATETHSTSYEAIEGTSDYEHDTKPFVIREKYISLASSLDLYDKLRYFLGSEGIELVLERLHDVNFLEHTDPQSPQLELRKSAAFQKSVLAGSSALESYGNGKQKIFPNDFAPSRFNFLLLATVGRFNNEIGINFTFDSALGLPSDIYVLIGRNGLGKTQLLYAIIRAFTGSSHPEPLVEFPLGGGNSTAPKFKKILSLALSPFEAFPRELIATGLIKYEYCGCRRSDGTYDIDGALSAIGEKLESIIRQDLHEAVHLSVKARPKLQSLIRALKEGLGITKFEVHAEANGQGAVGPIDLMSFIISSHTAAALPEALIDINNSRLLLDEVPLELMSAGQKMFILSAVNLVASIENSTLVLVDEPELYMHPNLECSYMKMFRAILNLFESRAIIATHSVFVARETTARNISILRETEGELIHTSPRFETFGADIGVISDYIFDNILQDKPFEEWLKGLVKTGMDLSSIKEKFGNSLNIESIAFIRAAIDERNKGRGNG